MRVAGSWLGQSLEDGAATALYLATSQEVREQNHRAQYFIPIATLGEPSAISRDIKLARELWVSTISFLFLFLFLFPPPFFHAVLFLSSLTIQDWIDAQATETLGLDWQYQ